MRLAEAITPPRRDSRRFRILHSHVAARMLPYALGERGNDAHAPFRGRR